MPIFLKSVEFWKAISVVIAAVLVYFFPDRGITVAMIEMMLYGILKLFFNVVPELRSRGLM